MQARPSPRRPLVSWIDDGGSMPIPDGRMRGIRSIRERDFLLGRVRSWHDSTAQPTILQSTHEAALDVVDLAAAARRILTCTRMASRRFWALTRRAGNETNRAAWVPIACQATGITSK